VKAGIRERTSDYVVSENSWPLFVYENYTFNSSDLEKGLFMSKILVQVSTWNRTTSRIYTQGHGVTRPSKPSLHHHLPQGKPMVMVMEPIFWRTTGALDGH
jgi:hypothetical protein